MGAPVDYAVVIGITLLVVALHALGLPWGRAFAGALVMVAVITFIGALLVHHTLDF